MLGGDPHHTGRSAYAGPQGPNVVLKWKTLIGPVEAIYASPVIGPDGTVYAANGNVMYALNGQTGAQLYNFTAARAIYSTPVVSPSGYVCVCASDSSCYCLHSATNALATQTYSMAGSGLSGVNSPLLTAAGLLVIGSEDAMVMAFTVGDSSGVAVWTIFSSAGYYFSSPALTLDGNIVIGGYDHYMHKLTAGAGSTMWSFLAGAAIDSSPAVAVDGSIVFGCYDSYTYCLFANGTLKWKTLMPNSPAVNSGASIAADGTVLIGDSAGAFWALNGATGTVRWNYTAKGAIQANAAIGADNTVHVVSYDKTVVALDVATGAVRWNYSAAAGIYSSPAIGTDGTLYFVAADGCVYALTTAPSPTPTARYAEGLRMQYRLRASLLS
jgi:outer membrane protein assembly factor BamB